MVATLHNTTTGQGYRRAPQPVRTQFDTTFEAGDYLAIPERGQRVIVEITDVRISERQYPSGGSARSVWYTLDYKQVEKPFLACSRIIGEKALEKLSPEFVYPEVL